MLSGTTSARPSRNGRRYAGQVLDIQQVRLHALKDLALTLKHVHWNVAGPSFIVAVHTMLDPK